MTGTLLKLVAAICIVGIAAVLGIVWLTDGNPTITPDDASDDASAPIVVAPPAGSAPSNEPADAPTTPDTETDSNSADSEAFHIEELSAECDEEGEEIGVSDLPLGADWRTTERGIYANTPVRITCEVDISTEDLTFEWSATHGEIQGNGSSITWVAPDHGAKSEVAVLVHSNSGTEQSAALHFRVVTCDCLYNRY